MGRMYGENAQKFAQRQAGQIGAKEANAAYAAGPHEPILTPIACTCAWSPYPHTFSNDNWGRAVKRTHDDPAGWRRWQDRTLEKPSHESERVERRPGLVR